MLLRILISFIITVLLFILIFFFTILLIKITEKIECYLDKKRNQLGKEKYEKYIWYIKTVLCTIMLTIFFTLLVYKFIFVYLAHYL